MKSDFCEKCKYKDFEYIAPELIPNSDLLIVGQNPREEDKGKPFSGESGKFLRKYLTKFDEKAIIYSITNAFKCKTPNNKSPTKKEMEICHPNLLEDIKITKPKLILALGKCAYMALTGENIAITSYVGKIIYDYPIPIAVCLHPSAITGYGRSIGDFEKGFLPALKYFEKQEELPYKIVNTIPPYRFPVGLDIETNSLNPYKGKLRSVSISEGTKALFAEVEE